MAIRRRKNRFCVELRPKWRSPIFKTFDTLLEAKRFEAEQKILLKRGFSRDVIKCSLADAIDRYERECSARKKSSRSEHYRLKSLKSDVLADAMVSHIQPEDIEDWLARRRATGVKEATILRDLVVFQSLLTSCIKWRYCLSNPIKGLLDKPKNSKGRERRVQDWELERLCEALEYRPEALIQNRKQATALAFLLAIETGMRQGELFHLCWSDVFFERAYVHLADSKNGMARDVPLSEEALRLLRQMQNSHFGGERVFPYAQNHCAVLFANAVKSCDIKDLRFHDSRHEACSRIARLEGMNSMLLMRIMGWRDIKTALIYFNPSVDDLVKARRQPERD